MRVGIKKMTDEAAQVRTGFYLSIQRAIKKLSQYIDNH